MVTWTTDLDVDGPLFLVKLRTAAAPADWYCFCNTDLDVDGSFVLAKLPTATATATPKHPTAPALHQPNPKSNFPLHKAAPVSLQ